LLIFASSPNYSLFRSVGDVEFPSPRPMISFLAIPFSSSLCSISNIIETLSPAGILVFGLCTGPCDPEGVQAGDVIPHAPHLSLRGLP